MTKAVFLRDLESQLKSLNNMERKKFISYYEEIIEDYIENGSTEETAVERVGYPESIAEDILKQESGTDKKASTTTKGLIGFLMVLGFPLWGSLLLAGILMVLSVYIVIWCLPVVVGSVAIATFSIAIVSVCGGFFLLIVNPALAIVQFGLGVVCVGIAILTTFATIYLSKKLIEVTKSFTLKLIGIFKR